MSTFKGKTIEFTIFGESHGDCVGISMSGLPKDFSPDLGGLKSFMERRRPGTSDNVSSRNENDNVIFEKELNNGAFSAIIKNCDRNSRDYEKNKFIPRPGTADFAQFVKDGEIKPGAGRFSGRMTAPLCIGGFFAISLLEKRGITIKSEIVRLGGTSEKGKMKGVLEKAKENGDSIGGVIRCTVENMPTGIGDFLCEGLESKISYLLFGIPGVKGVEFGSGFNGSDSLGSVNNDELYYENGKIHFKTNNSGGILGGVSTGEPIVFDVAFKPTPSIKISQNTVNLNTKTNETICICGRHDPCIVFRALPVVEACAALALYDEISTFDSKTPREQIDKIDSEISKLLEKRFDIVKKIGKKKSLDNVSVYDEKRENEVLLNIKNNAPNYSESVENIYRKIMSESRILQEKFVLKKENSELSIGLLGRKLGHSISPEIHGELSDYSYDILEKEPSEIIQFVRDSHYNGFNVTIPYKKTLYENCDVVSEISKLAGAVNTIIKKDGKLFGYNTDYFGFGVLLKINGIDVCNKNVVVLGSGGASGAVTYNLKKLGAKVSIVSRTGSLNYSNVYELCRDAEIIVNATPVGMMPNEGERLLSLNKFEKLTTVIDVIYNPSKTYLLMDAKLLGLKIVNGLSMLVAQAVLSSKLFTGDISTDSIENPDEFLNEIYRITAKFIDERNNIVLIGMPGSGKTTVGRELSHATGRVFIDLDNEFAKKFGITTKEAITSLGEEKFREMEISVAKSVKNLKHAVIATGGGVVEREENYYQLAENGIMLLVETPKEMIATHGRPLSKSVGVEKLLEKREKIYRLWADSKINIKL